MVLILLSLNRVEAQSYAKKLVSENVYTPTDVALLPNGNTVTAVGDRWSGVSTLSEITNDGDTVWTRDYMMQHAGDYGYIKRIQVLPNGNIVAGGYMHHGASPYWNRFVGYVMVLDPTGTILADKSFTSPLVTLEDFVVADNGNIYVGGYHIDVFSGGVSYYEWEEPTVLKLDANLNIIWEMEWGNHGSSYTQQLQGKALGMEIDGDQNVTVIGYEKFNGTLGGGYHNIFQMDSMGAVNWSYKTTARTGAQIKDISAAPNGDIFTIENDTTGIFTVRKISKDGQLRWRKFATGPSNETAVRLDYDEVNNRLLAVGGNNLYEIDTSGTSGSKLNIPGYSLKAVTETGVGNTFALATFSWDTSAIIQLDGGFQGCSVGTKTALMLADTAEKITWQSLSTQSTTINSSPVNFVDTNVTTTITAECYTPSCFADADFNLSGPTRCQNQMLLVDAVEHDSILNLEWYLDNVLLAQPGFDWDTTLSTQGIHTLKLMVYGSGCLDSAQHSFEVLPISQVSLSETLCPGESLLFGGNVLTDAGTYFDTLSNFYLCDSIVEMVVTISAPDTNVTRTGNSLVAAGSNTNYQWIDCMTGNPIAGAIQVLYNLSTGELVAVIVTNSDACSDTSACYSLDETGITQYGAEGFRFYPSPAAAFIIVELEAGSQVHTVRWLNMAGAEISRTRITGEGAHVHLHTPSAAGSYVLEVDTKDQLHRRLVLVGAH